jgi:cyclic pyranopterin phosphate synthase
MDMKDRYGRTIGYLRVSVTDRCNLRCRYCMPPDGVGLLPRSEILSFEEIIEVVRTAVGLGVTKVRLTGGEPLVRRGIETLVAELAQIEGIRDLAMTTNGVLLEQRARDLADAGLHRVNVSLDAVRPERYAEVTGGGDVRLVLAGIDEALHVGLTPVKLNCVVSDSSDEPDARDVADYGREKGLEVRFIPVIDPVAGSFSVVEGGHGGDCPRCNRLRLTSTGVVRPCLLSDLGFSVREMGIEAALRRAVAEKPEAGGPCSANWMRAVGG